MKSNRLRFTLAPIGGFGFGVWRTKMSLSEIWWTIAIGPLTWHMRILLTDREVLKQEARQWVAEAKRDARIWNKLLRGKQNGK
jgi:hypothetical protein